MSKKILIVDDEEIVCKICVKALRQNYEVTCVNSGVVALDVFQREQPDLLLMDLNMPEMTGYEVMEELGKRGILNVPVIFMTSNEDTESEVRGFEMGAKDYIRKPFIPDVLLKRIEKIISNEETKKMLEKDADTDPLTGLMNRRAVEALVDEYVSVKQDSGVLLMIDIDNFKQVNDNFGHEVGDRLLKLLADTLKPYTRAYDVLGRLGGDEFIIFYQGFQNMESLVERCRNINAKTEYVLNDMLGNAATIPLSISIGVARAPEDGEDFNTLYMNADKALYHVKQNGKRGYYFYEGGCNSIHSISEDDHAIDILQVRMMIEEHSKLPGAYSVSYEDFKKIYRFLKRRAERTETDAQFVLFTLHDDDRRSGKILQENSTDKYAEQNAVEKKDILREFGTIAEKTLRRGDVAAQYGQSQYMMLLTGTNQSNGLIAVNRILDNWKNDNIGSEFHMEYEMQDLAV